MTGPGDTEQGERFVATKAARGITSGRETDVLAALGIDWKHGDHISCPYPDHDDSDPSWRWVERKQHAVCTCIGRRPGEKGAHSIFDVVMAVQQCDFEAAKVRIAELLGAGHLIRTKGERQDCGGFRADAASLLNPPPELRDDSLVAAYLGSRLGIPPGQVMLPATPVAGWRQFPYKEKAGKAWSEIGRWPMVVFGTALAGVRRIAQRIYVGPGGQGKAEIPPRPDGKPRDVKKASTPDGDEQPVGLCIWWGRPEAATTVVIAEGPETAAAVAHALAAEIQAGRVVVGSAMTAGGIERFVPAPNHKAVVVAADRDEHPEKPHRQGERSARIFALQHYRQVEVGIALPGAPGRKLDWLDVWKAEGAEAVRRGVLEEVVPFAPTAEELRELEQRRDRAAELAEVAKTYPLPAMDNMTLAYDHTPAGKVRVHKTVDREDPKIGKKVPTLVPISSPFGVLARLRYMDQADAYGLRVVVQDMEGRPRFVDFGRAELAKMGGQEIRAALLAAGLRPEEDGEAIAVAALKAADPAREVSVVNRSGWHRTAGLPHPVFVGPAGEAIGAPDEKAVELSVNARLAEPVRAGSLAEWKRAVAAACGALDCPHWILGVVAGFAGVIVSLTNMDTCGINLSGMSSAGKTTAQKLAVSAWSCPTVGVGLLQSMRTTENALESLAQASTGTVLALDEMAHVEGRTIARMIYSVASGIGKARASRTSGMRDRHTWATYAVLSGECSLEEKVRGDGGQWLAGMAVRITDVDVSGVNRAVPQATLEAMDLIESNFGHAGPAFVEGLIRDGYNRFPDRLRNAVMEAARDLAGDDADSALRRAALPLGFLVVAGALAKRYRLLPEAADVAAAVNWAWARFKSSSDAGALKPEEQALANIRHWIAERWDVTIRGIEPAPDGSDPGKRPGTREAVGWYDADTVYLPAKRIHEAAGGAAKEALVSSLLVSGDFLSRRGDGRHVAIRYIPKIGQVRSYALRRSEFGRPAADEARKPPMAVVGGWDHE